MNRKKVSSALIATGLIGCLSLPISADVIVLHDGSRIKGEVLSMSGGQYRIRTDALGEVTVSKSKIRSIESGSSMPSASVSDAPAKSNIGAIQSQLTSDQGIMSMIMQLQTDPDMQAVLNDPEVMRAVQSFDLQALQSNPKIQKLMQNQKVRQIQGRVQ